MALTYRHLSRIAVIAALLLVRAHERRRAARRSRRSLLQQVQRRRDGHHRRVGVGAQEDYRGLRARSQLFRRQGQRRVDRRLEPGSSQIKDTRKQKTATVEYVHDKTTYSVSYIDSVERDYKSNTTHVSLSQDMFGDLTTVTLGFDAAATVSARTTAPPSFPSSPGWVTRRRNSYDSRGVADSSPRI